MFNIAKKKKKTGLETFKDSVKLTLNSTFVDALGPRDAIEFEPKSNTDTHFLAWPWFREVDKTQKCQCVTES